MSIQDDKQKTPYGFVSSGSTSSVVRLFGMESAADLPVVGRSVYIDLDMNDGVYRALGTVTDVETFNKSFANNEMNSVRIQGTEGVNLRGRDLRSSVLKIQSTYFRKNDSEMWQKRSSALPTSPSSGLYVYLLDEETIEDMTAAEEDTIVHLGTMRGLSSAHAPLVVPNFSSQRGATHKGVLGRSGSGKTAFASFALGADFSHEDHAVIVVDPQGQWANENGFLYSVQDFAEALGREVSVLRVAEDIKLPLKEELLSQLFDHVDLWGRGFQRMGNENKVAFSDEVASKIARDKDAPEKDPRELLSDVFKTIARSTGTLRRIYATTEKIEGLQRTLNLLAGIAPENSDGVEEEIDEDEWQDIETTWERILSRFVPLINLFARQNLNGGKRRSLGGSRGFLRTVMQVREESPDTPAPYVILDMSSDVKGKAKQEYAKGLKVSNENSLNVSMKQILDNEDIKAIIVMEILQEIKSSAEDAFAEGGGNLNTQIVFDEAWRYARNVTSAETDTPIGQLSSMLEGFALDTRKYGIGWTYILQVPSDLNRGIWRQLSYVYSGYGIIGGDKKMLGELMDEKDREAQMGLYDQFAPPSSTGKYPFMLNGPISPLIFTNTPVFVDAYNSIDEFVKANAHWIEKITRGRQLPSIIANPERFAIGKNTVRKQRSFAPVVQDDDAALDNQPIMETKKETFKIGGTKMGAPPPRRSTTAKPAEPQEKFGAHVKFGAVEEPPF